MDVMRLNSNHPLFSPLQLLMVFVRHKLTAAGTKFTKLPVLFFFPKLWAEYILSLKTLFRLKPCDYHAVFPSKPFSFPFHLLLLHLEPGIVSGGLWCSHLPSHMANQWPWAACWLLLPSPLTCNVSPVPDSLSGFHTWLIYVSGLSIWMSRLCKLFSFLFTIYCGHSPPSLGALGDINFNGCLSSCPVWFC